jgi:TonB family protein
VSHSQLLFLLLSSIWKPIQQPPRPCAGTVVMDTDTTVARLGPETESLLQWTMSVPGPEYPAELRSQREAGQVIARFVVDTNGRVVRGTAMILSESHRGFGRSVCQFLTRAKLRPLPVDGRKRSVTVSASPFEFSFGR